VKRRGERGSVDDVLEKIAKAKQFVSYLCDVRRARVGRWRADEDYDPDMVFGSVLSAAEAEIEQLRKALRFYALSSNYSNDPERVDAPIDLDEGDIARQATHTEDSSAPDPPQMPF
jgi:hypothetical protein